MIINETEIRKAIEQLHADDKLFEIRIINGRSKKPISGYFRDADTLLEKFKTVDLNGANVYITLNQLDESLFSRVQSECFVAMRPRHRTKKSTVIGGCLSTLILSGRRESPVRMMN